MNDTNRWGSRLHRFARALLLLMLLTGVASLALPPAPVMAAASAEDRSLILADVVVDGATRTPRATILRHLDLQPGQAITQQDLLDGVEALRARSLFAEVDFFTRPGEKLGELVLVLEVVEHRFNFRWGVGNTDLDGWYVSPLALANENLTGRGDLLQWQWRVGFRHSGTILRYARTEVGSGRDYWETKLSFLTTDRPYFDEGVEYRHAVDRNEAGFIYGRRLDEHGLLESGLSVGLIDSAEKSVAYFTSPDGSIEMDQEIPLADQPAAIADAHGKAGRAVLHLDWQRDTRGPGRRAGSPTRGMWGRLKGTFTLQEDHSHPGLHADLRHYREVPGGVLASRLRGAWVGDNAAFYDRLYLGGMYTVRGFPTHALSAPGGDTWLTSASLEWRSRILGDSRGTSLAGVLFLDAGASGSDRGTDPYGGLAASVGYGLRIRVPWLDWIGVDVGFPLTDRPLDQRFQVNASIGWSF